MAEGNGEPKSIKAARAQQPNENGDLVANSKSSSAGGGTKRAEDSTRGQKNRECQSVGELHEDKLRSSYTKLKIGENEHHSQDAKTKCFIKIQKFHIQNAEVTIIPPFFLLLE
jgi:hypothetical protein